MTRIRFIRHRATSTVRPTVERLDDRTLPSFANVLVNDPAADVTRLDTQSETALVLGAGNTIIAAYNDSGSVIENFDAITGFAVSSDGGATFTDKGFLPPNPSGDGGDPVLARSNKTGTIFLSVIQFDSETFDAAEGIHVHRTVDNGASWLPAANGTPGFIRGVDFGDKPWIAVDNFPGPGQGNVYLAWLDATADRSRSGVHFTRSTDDGATWGPTGGVRLSELWPPGSKGAHSGITFIAVGPDHAVYVFFWDTVNTSRLLMRKSTDQGATFGPAVTVVKLKTPSFGGDLGLGGFRVIVQMQAAVNPINGDIYLTYHDKGESSDAGNIYLVRSADGGATWGDPVRVNDDATRNDQWTPAMALTPDGSKLGIFWYDRRLDPANRLIDRFGVIGDVSDYGVSFGANFRITDASFPPAFNQDPVLRPDYMGDYDQAAADNDFFYTTWGDNRLGNAFHANQPDVRFAKIPVAAGDAGNALAGVAAPPARAVSAATSVEGFASEALARPAVAGRGTTAFVFTVTLSAPSAKATTIGYETADGTASTGTDSDGAAGILMVAPGEAAKRVAVVVNGDGKREANGDSCLDLFANSGNSLFANGLGVGTILNDD
jgi:hypothetical protein